MNVKPLYDFYKTPDGDDCLEKVYYATKYATVTGLVVSFMDMGLMSYPKTIPLGIGRLMHYTPVYAAMGATLTCTICLAGQIRKKDDFFNHALGGVVAGSVFGARHGSALTGGRLGGVMALIFGTIKYLRSNDIPFMRIQSRKYNTYNPHLDFSIKMYDDPGRPLDP